MTKLYILLAVGAAMQLVVQGAPVQGTCKTPQCIEVAKGIQRDMQPAADPCVDFSQYTCGGFYEHTTIPGDYAAVDAFSSVQDMNNDIIRSIVTPGGPKAPVVDKKDIVGFRNVQKLQSLYSACMNEDQLVKIGRKPLEAEIRKVIELYPGTDGNHSLARRDLPDGDRHGLSSLLGYYMKNDFSSFFTFSVNADELNPTQHIMTISLSLDMLSTYIRILSSEDVLQQYLKTVSQMFFFVQGEETIDTDVNGTIPEVWTQVATDVVQFEAAIANISIEASKLITPETKAISRAISELHELTPSLDWDLILKTALPSDVPVPKNAVITTPEYFSKLDALLQQTKPKTLQNYFAWSIMRAQGKLLSEPYQAPLLDFSNKLRGTTEIPERWKRCVDVVNAQLPQMAGHYYLERVFGSKVDSKLKQMINNLRRVYTIGFKEQYKWLDPETAKNALTKLDAIEEKIGGSIEDPNVFSSQSVDEFYHGYTVNDEDHYGNYLRSRAWTTMESFRLLTQPVSKKQMDVGVYPQMVNAFYYPNANSIIFPAGILFPPFFHIDNPEYLNYGSIGMIAGHEIGHGFDNTGRKYDQTGRLANWWTNSSLEEFTVRSQCFVDQYSNFTIEGPGGKSYPVNGQLTLGENIGDNGGLKKSFEAWSAQFQSDPMSKTYNNNRLPGLESYTPEQLFFIQYGRLWCSKSRPEALVAALDLDPHSPNKWRINGAVQNSEYFAKAFQCKPGTPMNPVKKCDLW
ncbi:hypothetical protein BGZ68_000828 [Mortierella alpina]|nr:hypothetical protein BGZ68_000828 [Mortierella alpina]